MPKHAMWLALQPSPFGQNCPSEAFTPWQITAKNPPRHIGFVMYRYEIQFVFFPNKLLHDDHPTSAKDAPKSKEYILQFCTRALVTTSANHRHEKHTLHGSDIRALDVVLKIGFELLLELIGRDQLVLCKNYRQSLLRHVKQHYTHRRRE